MELAETKSHLIENAKKFDSYGKSRNSSVTLFYKERLRLGKIFLHIKASNRSIFCPSRFSGYENNSMQKHLAFEEKTGTKTTQKINRIIKPHKPNKKSEEEYLNLCNELSINPSNKKREYWIINFEGNIEEISDSFDSESNYPDEINGFTEGNSKKELVNKYERDKKARTECIKHYGCKCVVCEFDFEKTYGNIGEGFIHVHHLIPLSRIDKQYKVNPINDLRPVCPNCHSMLHKSDPPFSINELLTLINENSPNE